jgi:hypothetical protein
MGMGNGRTRAGGVSYSGVILLLPRPIRICPQSFVVSPHSVYEGGADERTCTWLTQFVNVM